MGAKGSVGQNCGGGTVDEKNEKSVAIGGLK